MADEFNNQNPGTQSADVQQAVTAALQDEKKKKKKKKKKLIILGVVAVIIIIIGVLASGGSDDSGNTVESVDGQSVSSTENTTQKIEAGNAVTIGDDIKITYTSCDPDFTDYSEYATVTDGKKVIKATFTVENISDTDQYIDTINCYADNQKCDTFIYVDDYDNPFFNTISSGRSVSGSVYFEVDENATDIELEFESDVWTDDKVIFVVK